MLKVHARSPVDRVILCDGTARTVGGQQVVESRVEAEVCGMVSFHLSVTFSIILTGCAKADMEMLRRLSWCHNRIDTSITQLAKAQVTEEGMSRSDVEEQCNEEDHRAKGERLELNARDSHDDESVSCQGWLREVDVDKVLGVKIGCCGEGLNQG